MSKETSENKLNEAVKYLEITINEVLKPALKRQEEGIQEINNKLGQDIYAKQSEVNSVKSDVEDLKKTTRNTPLVQKVVFTLAGLMLAFLINELLKRSFTNGGVG